MNESMWILVVVFLAGGGCVALGVVLWQYYQRKQAEKAAMLDEKAALNKTLELLHQRTDELNRAMSGRRTHADIALFEDVIALLDHVRDEMDVQNERAASYWRQRAKHQEQILGILESAIRRLAYGRNHNPLDYGKDDEPDRAEVEKEI